jgi:hypothetical protein
MPKTNVLDPYSKIWVVNETSSSSIVSTRLLSSKVE